MRIMAKQGMVSTEDQESVFRENGQFYRVGFLAIRQMQTANVNRRVLRLLCMCTVLFLLGVSGLRAQDVEDYYARMLEQEVEVADPVKRPVVAFGFGLLHPLGEIRSPRSNFIDGTFGARVNITTLVGKSKQLKINAYVLYGRLQGIDYARSYGMNNAKPLVVRDRQWYPNTAFQTEVYEIGFSTEYNFWQLIGKRKNFRPFVSLGAGVLVYTPKGNYLDANDQFYRFWSDGTIRMGAEGTPGASALSPVRMDKVFETDMKKMNIYGLKSFPPVSAVFPLEAGVDFYLSDRTWLRFFTSIRYTLTDLLDGYDANVAKLYGQKSSPWHDMYAYTGLQFHLDMFSQAESFIVDREFVDIDFDYEVFMSDQDNDGVFDIYDECPDTPEGVAVDSVGCPVDRDRDGVPDYLDKETYTEKGQPVDEEGRLLSDKERSLPTLNPPPVERSKVKMQPVSRVWNRRYRFAEQGIPSKFQNVDLDGDGYISYDEILKAIDDYFTGRSDFTPDDIYELNAFFFEQP